MTAHQDKEGDASEEPESVDVGLCGADKVAAARRRSIMTGSVAK